MTGPTNTAQTRRDLLRRGAAAGALALCAPALRAAPRPLRIGFISPQTGPLAAFGEADRFVLDHAARAIGAGIGPAGAETPVEIIARDSQSNPNRCAEVAADLILREEIDLLLASSTGDTTNPAADQAELEGLPCITTDTPWEAHFFGRNGDPATGFEHSFHFFWGLSDLTGVFTDMWARLAPDAPVGAVFSNDVEGVALSHPEQGFPGPIRAAGHDLSLPGLATPGTQDFTAFVQAFAKARTRIVTGALTPPDFAAFWAQAAQQGLRDRLVICSIAKAMLFPAAAEALGDSAEGITTEVWWSPGHPFRSSLSGESAAQYAAAWTAASGRQWTQPLGFKHALIEVAIDALTRADDPRDPAALRDAIASTRLDTLVGPVGWSFGDRRNPVPGVCTTPLVGGQWKRGAGAHPWDLAVVDNARAPGIPLSGELTPLGPTG